MSACFQEALLSAVAFERLEPPPLAEHGLPAFVIAALRPRRATALSHSLSSAGLRCEFVRRRAANQTTARCGEAQRRELTRVLAHPGTYLSHLAVAFEVTRRHLDVALVVESDALIAAPLRSSLLHSVVAKVARGASCRAEAFPDARSGVVYLGGCGTEHAAPTWGVAEQFVVPLRNGSQHQPFLTACAPALAPYGSRCTSAYLLFQHGARIWAARHVLPAGDGSVASRSCAALSRMREAAALCAPPHAGPPLLPRSFDEINGEEGDFLIGWLEPPIFCSDSQDTCALYERASSAEGAVILLVIGVGVFLLTRRLRAFLSLTWWAREGMPNKVHQDQRASASLLLLGSKFHQDDNS
ncbi:hypothetical protein AB1Y20_013668 [Prymnesium parvum]|uniref:Glycosyltransferase family 25 protein n=1 Tax=Prymnesium parvum TaxID=97485 RepID=A0AB34IJB3_PRYPA